MWLCSYCSQIKTNWNIWQNRQEYIKLNSGTHTKSSQWTKVKKDVSYKFRLNKLRHQRVCRLSSLAKDTKIMKIKKRQMA